MLHTVQERKLRPMASEWQSSGLMGGAPGFQPVSEAPSSFWAVNVTVAVPAPGHFPRDTDQAKGIIGVI